MNYDFSLIFFNWTLKSSFSFFRDEDDLTEKDVDFAVSLSICVAMKMSFNLPLAM